MPSSFGAYDWGSLVRYFIIYGIGFILGSYGGMYSECSGIINIALEGSMVVGAFSGVIFMKLVGEANPTSFLVTTTAGVQLFFLLAGLVAIVVGILFSYLLSFVSIKLKANQTIVGTALNTFAVAACTIINTSITGIDSPEVSLGSLSLSQYLSPDTGNEFFNFALMGLNVAIIIGFVAIIVLWLVMNKTRFGLRLRACGENPAACDSVGINVNRMRYTGTLIGSAAAAFGGFIIFSYFDIFVGNWQIDALGYGFLVLAIEIFGNWKATNIIFAALFFAFFSAFAPTFTSYLSTFPQINSILTNRAFYYMLPYLLAFLSLIFFSKHSHVPKAEGIPYDKSEK